MFHAFSASKQYSGMFVCLAAPKSRVMSAALAVKTVCNLSLCYLAECFRNWLGFIGREREREAGGGTEKLFKVYSASC